MAETLQAYGCRIAVRHVQGSEAKEIFLLCEPPALAVGPDEQAAAIYRAIRALLESEGGGEVSLVSEVVFHRDASANVELVRAARQRVFPPRGGIETRSAITEIEQPPLDDRSHVVIAAQAIVPVGGALEVDLITAPSASDGAEPGAARGLLCRVGAETRLYVGGLCARGEDACAQARSVFERAEALVREAGMDFGDVVRTWIHLRDIERDYADLNRARRGFFEARGIDPPPASTGIGGPPVGEDHDLCLGLYALKAEPAPARVVMTSPTLNEAPQYGADFVRGVRLEETNKIALHVSGTASVDEAGGTAHVGDFDAQVDRMLVNLEALLEVQGAGFEDVVSAISYLKHPRDADRLRAKFREAGFEGFPNALVQAEVCRPELLCETELLAVLPAVGSRASGGG